MQSLTDQSCPYCFATDMMPRLGTTHGMVKQSRLHGYAVVICFRQGKSNLYMTSIIKLDKTSWAKHGNTWHGTGHTWPHDATWARRQADHWQRWGHHIWRGGWLPLCRRYRGKVGFPRPPCSSFSAFTFQKRPALSVIISVDPKRSLPCQAPFSWTYHWIRWSFLFQIDSDSECPAWADEAHTQKFEQTWTNPQTWTLVLGESIESLAQVGMYDDRRLGVSCFNQQLAESPP